MVKCCDAKKASDKLKSDNGTTVLIYILLIAIAVMVVIIVVPYITSTKEQERMEQDKGHELVAKDSAYMKFIEDGSFEAVYDAVSKEFVDVKDIKTVPAYGNAKEHKGLVILVKTDEEGNATLKWVDPAKYTLEKTQEKKAETD